LDVSSLVRRLQQGDDTAFEPLYRHYIDQAVRVAFLITRSQQTAEDAAQEAFIQVLRKVHTLQDPASFRSWFYSILLNAARRTGRKGRKWLLLPFDLLRQDQADVHSLPPDEAVELKCEVQEIRTLLGRLPDIHRFPIVLRYYAELTELEIALALDLPVGTVKSRLHNARQKLSSLMQPPEPREGGSARGAR
jgi:RNA polymerase sigma-70 factor (ECF subfamily)